MNVSNLENSILRAQCLTNVHDGIALVTTIFDTDSFVIRSSESETFEQSKDVGAS